MFKVGKDYRTETGHRLLNYDGRCSHIHGHSYKWHVEVGGSLDYRGMVIDFKDLKIAMDMALDPFDHALVLHEHDPFIKAVPLATNGEPQRLILMTANPTAENLALAAGQRINGHLRDMGFVDTTVTQITLKETETSIAVITHADIADQPEIGVYLHGY